MDYKYALIRHGNVPLCDFCNEPAVKEHAFMQCKSCGDSWDRTSKYREQYEKIYRDPISYKELEKFLRD